MQNFQCHKVQCDIHNFSEVDYVGRLMETCFATLPIAGRKGSARSRSTNAFPLWPNGAPGALGNKSKDIPTLTPFLPPARKATGAAMVICPGGGYEWLAPHEGRDYARWLNLSGVTCFVLKYRLGSNGYRYPAMFLDAARALRLVRSQAREWNLDPHRIGIMGSSAGGHLASTLLTHFDAGNAGSGDPIERAGSRPDLGILCYPVITLGKFTHEGSKENLLGKNPSPRLIRKLSNQRHAAKDTPPCFIWATCEDEKVPVENSMMFAAALRQAGVAFELHIGQKGVHGLGLGSRTYNPGKWLPWTRACMDWLKLQHFVK